MFSKKSPAATPAKPDTKLSGKALQPALFEKPAAPARLEQPAKQAAPTPVATPAQPTQSATSNAKDTAMNTNTPKPPSQPQGSIPAPAFRPDLVRPDMRADFARDMNRRGEMGRHQMRRADGSLAHEPGAEMRKLIVGRDIALAGEISACDYLVVEGTVEARVREGRHIEIADSGLFRGTVEIDEADIAGRFEGDITVRGRLRVRSTGRIDGKVQYGELEVEAGGHLEGEVHGLKPVAKPAAAQPKARTFSHSEPAAATASATATPQQQTPPSADTAAQA